MLRKKNILNILVDKKFLVIVAIASAFGLASLWVTTGNLVLLVQMGLHGMVPIGLAAVGEVLNEKGGLFNIGIEGIILTSAFTSIYAAEIAKSWAAGLLVGMATGALISFIFSIIATYGRGNQLIAGIGINTFAAGFVAFYVWQIWQPGHHLLSSSGLAVPDISTPFGTFSWMIPVTIGIGILIYLILNKTRFGMRVRAAGNNPFVTDVSGINVYRLRIMACVVGGALAGLAGAYMSLDWLGMITTELVAGRGFIALATVVFSGLNPLLALAGAGLFGFFDGFSLWLRNVPWAKSLMAHGGRYFFMMLPYLIVLIVLAVFIGKRRFPKAIGKPYRREEG